MNKDDLAETIFQQYVKAPNATAMTFADMRMLIEKHDAALLSQANADKQKLITAMKIVFPFLHYDIQENKDDLIPEFIEAYNHFKQALKEHEANQ